MAQSRAIDVSEFIDRSRVSPFQVTTIVICGLVAMLDGFDAQLIGYVIPAIAKAWGIQGPAIGATFKWAVFWGLVGLTLGALGGGPLADRFGRKTVMLASVLIFGVFSIVTASATDIATLSLFRFLTGLGLGGSMPNTIALTAEYSPRRLRTTLITVMFTGFPIGNVAAGLASAALIEHYGWQGVFYAGGIAPLVLLPFALLLLPESVRFLVAQRQSGARVAATLGRIALDPALRPDARYTLPEAELKGLPVKHLFRDGRAAGTLLLWLAFFMNLLIIYFFVTWLPQLLGQVGLSAQHSILTAALFNSGGAIGGVIVGILTDRSEPYKLVIGAFAAAVPCIVGVAFAGASLPMLVVSIFLTGVTVVGAQNGINALAARLYPTDVRSTGVSWGLGIGRIGSIVGPFIGGVLISMGWRPNTLFLVVAVPAAIATVGMIFMSRTALARHA
ncbi:MAG TPA: aromatic acid/H+ symport family MFS transporter [Stellaceae bacterium]|nr:aromatic acid/H+ symport family MFS transporter [Stellaceae bacterium]